MCANCKSVQPVSDGGKSRRRWLWESYDNAHCPVIGTCLSHDDLLKIGKRLRLQFEPGFHDYDLHAYFVKATTTDSKEARAIHKLLDERHRGALRRFGRLQCEDDIVELWDEMRNSGQIAGAFYAIMTLRHVSKELRAKIFGEVHMLSHLIGASFRKQSMEVASLREQLSTLQEKRERVEIGLHSALEERDVTIGELKLEITQARSKITTNSSSISTSVEQIDQHKTQLAIERARERALAAEKDAKSLRQENKILQKRMDALERQMLQSMPESNEDIEQPDLTGQSILYLGGRHNQIPHFQKLVDSFGATMVYHDGGLEDAVARIDEVLPSVDCVFCPINCVSHDACLRAKHGCKKFGKTFVPLRSASKASLRQALFDIGSE